MLPALRLASLLLILASVVPAYAQDAAEFVVRLNRIEGQVRQLSGQIEQLQFENRQLRDQLRKFQEDTEFRFQERGGGRSQAPAASQPSTSTPSQNPGSPAPSRPRGERRGDAFDPNQSPAAPGAPRPLGTTPPSAAIPESGTPRVATAPVPPLAAPAGEPAPNLPPADVGAPGRPLPQGALPGDEDEEEGPGGPLDLNRLQRVGPGVLPPGPAPALPQPSIGAVGSDPRIDYEAAYSYLLARQYEQAEMGFRKFLQSHPRDRLVPDAVFWLGESYLARNRHREAAEQFLKVSTEHSRAAKAPDAMLKLGVALNALGARDQACATFAELERKYPQAAPTVRQGVEREQKRARCA